MLTFAISLGGCAAVKVEVAATSGDRAGAVHRVRIQISAWQLLAVVAAGAGAGTWPATSGDTMQHPLTRWVCSRCSMTARPAILAAPASAAQQQRAVQQCTVQSRAAALLFVWRSCCGCQRPCAQLTMET
jgi:hypothetical protein